MLPPRAGVLRGAVGSWERGQGALPRLLFALDRAPGPSASARISKGSWGTKCETEGGKMER